MFLKMRSKLEKNVVAGDSERTLELTDQNFQRHFKKIDIIELLSSSWEEIEILEMSQQL